jgi:antitoxin MazE
MQAQVLKWGNGLAVGIPKPVAGEAHLEVGDWLEIAVAADGTVELHRVGDLPTLAQMVDQITPENRYPEVSAGAGIGREITAW